jgi:hypothetical protein
LHAQAGEGFLTGSVFDPSGDAVIPGVEITVTGSGRTVIYTADRDGIYRFHLVPGTYDISASGNLLYPLRRFPVRIGSGQTTILNLYPSFRLGTQALVVTAKGAEDQYSYWPLPQFETLTVATGSEYLIEFKSKTNLKGTAQYKGTGFERVKITRDSLTILAEKVLVESSGRIVATGKVLIDDNGARTQTDRYELR